MKLACICFTLGGQQLAEGLMPQLSGWNTQLSLGFGSEKENLRLWTENAFATADALLFIGAAGIAVRSIAPYIKSKTTDPAVLVLDEMGQYVVPLLSGHIGGANQLARQLAALTGGQAVLTTATDVRGLWAVDEWATKQGLFIANPSAIKTVSAQLLRGESVALYSDATLTGPFPQGIIPVENPQQADTIISAFVPENPQALHLVPPCIAVGIGCRRGVQQQALEAACQQALEGCGILPQAVCGVFSIDLKKNELGLLAFCEEHHLPLCTYSADTLDKVAGSESSSDFVKQTTGVDNVCERSALAEGGRLILPKQAQNGVTIALAIREISLSLEELLGKSICKGGSFSSVEKDICAVSLS